MFFYLIVIIIDYKRLKISFNNNEKTSIFSDVNLLYKFLNFIGIMK